MHNYQAQKLTSQSTASIIGARGYTGLELARLLLNHPAVVLTHCFATQEFSLSNDILDERAKQVTCLPESEIMQNLTDIVFLATPAEVSLKLAPALLAKGKRVIDLSGAFRLKENDYKKWYHFEHTEPAVLAEAEYGLSPYCGPGKAAALIANPGCYATAIAMALIPLLKRNLIDPGSIVIDAKSGTSGAGRKATENLLFTEVSGECLPYRVGKHQHLPEIQETVSLFAGAEIHPHFATHLLATPRGIIASIYANTAVQKLATIEAAFAEEYAGYPLVRYGSKINQLASLKQVVGSPYTHLSYELVDGKLFVFSCIDNLLKGAASQAVENLNRLLDLPVHFTLATSADAHQLTGHPVTVQQPLAGRSAARHSEI